jgi:hypothetical protein
MPSLTTSDTPLKPKVSTLAVSNKISFPILQTMQCNRRTTLCKAKDTMCILLRSWTHKRKITTTWTNLHFFCLYFVFEIGFPNFAGAGLETTIQSSWDDKPPHLTGDTLWLSKVYFPGSPQPLSTPALYSYSNASLLLPLFFKPSNNGTKEEEISSGMPADLKICILRQWRELRH